MYTDIRPKMAILMFAEKRLGIFFPVHVLIPKANPKLLLRQPVNLFLIRVL